MKSFLILSVFCFLVSCSSYEYHRSEDKSYPGYHHTRQQDQQSLRAGFLDR